jgi:hypothetical protein
MSNFLIGANQSHVRPHEAHRVIGFHCPTDNFRPGALVDVLTTTPAAVEWDSAALAVVCRTGSEIVRLAVEPGLWVNLWIEETSSGLLASVEEALVWGCGAAPVVAELPDRLMWVLPLLASDRSEVREGARAVVSACCESAAAVANQDFEAAAQSREAALVAAARLAEAEPGAAPDPATWFVSCCSPRLV